MSSFDFSHLEPGPFKISTEERENPRSLRVYRLGLVDYRRVHALQEWMVEERRFDRLPDSLLLLEHQPVVTLGRGGDDEQLRFPRQDFQNFGVDLVDIGRGGGATYHGPGQIVGYPIINLAPERQDIRKYVQTLEDTMIHLAASYGLSAQRIDGKEFIGVWLRDQNATPGALADRKIGAIGVRISRWITMHGFAFNVNTNLAHFGLIVPCGIQGKGVTSLAVELGEEPAMAEGFARVETIFAKLWGARTEEGDANELWKKFDEASWLQTHDISPSSSL